MRRFFKLIGLGVLCGLFMLAVKHAFRIDDETFKIFSWVLFGGIVILAVLFNIVWTYPMRKKVMHFIKMMEEGRTEECIPEMEELLSEAREKRGKKTVRFYEFNLAAGYIEVRRYEDALELLNNIPSESLHGDSKLVYELNRATAYFMLDDREKFLEIYKCNEKLFKAYKNNKHYSANISVINILAEVCRENLLEAKAELSKAKEKYTQLRFRRTFEEIEKIFKENLE